MDEKRSGLRDKLLGGKPSKTVALTAPGGEQVNVAPLSGSARAALLKLIGDKGRDRQHQLEVVHPALVVGSLRDPDTGALIFGADDSARVMELDSAFLDDVVKAALEVSGLKAESLEEAGKGSAATPTAAQPSPSA